MYEKILGDVLGVIAFPLFFESAKPNPSNITRIVGLFDFFVCFLIIIMEVL